VPTLASCRRRLIAGLVGVHRQVEHGGIDRHDEPAQSGYFEDCSSASLCQRAGPKGPGSVVQYLGVGSCRPRPGLP